MSNTVSIQPMRVPKTIGDTAALARGGGPAPPAPTAKPVQPYTNPDLRLDPALGLVVIEFHDDSGKLTNSIPSQRQIDAYRMNDVRSPGQSSTPQPRPEHVPGPAPVDRTLADQISPDHAPPAADTAARATVRHGETPSG